MEVWDPYAFILNKVQSIKKHLVLNTDVTVLNERNK